MLLRHIINITLTKFYRSPWNVIYRAYEHATNVTSLCIMIGRDLAEGTRTINKSKFFVN